MITLNNIFVLVLLCALFSLYHNMKTFLLALLKLEFLQLIIIIYSLLMFMTISTMSYTIILLTLSVCEAGVGLSILISYMSFHGNDYVKGVTKV
uniref:NADH dehydrogenase subunit 4L n=1 Tax=Synprosphyma basilissa planicollis TaxID=1885900 RepID=A0A224ABK2_9EUPU|nr:NADH dehydrogenase subunit 4L [Synprosphyma basilissa planicollis]